MKQFYLIMMLFFVTALGAVAQTTNIATLTQKANAGDAKAQNELGDAYYYGKGVAKDFTEATKWYRKAAEQGNASAQYSLGFCYENGKGVTKNLTEAVKWYRKAVEQGNANAQYNLGCCYENGEGVTKNLTEAAKWYRKAAEQGDKDAQFNLGFCYENGKGVTKNLTEAVKWYRKAAEQGNKDAQDILKEHFNLILFKPSKEEISHEGTASKSEETIYDSNDVEEKPQYPGGQEALWKFISQNLSYPAVAQENGVQGKVVVSFVVEANGVLSDIEIKRGVDPSLDREALRIVRAMPRWKTGKIKGVPVRVKQSIPISFNLKSE